MALKGIFQLYTGLPLPKLKPDHYDRFKTITIEDDDPEPAPMLANRIPAGAMADFVSEGMQEGIEAFLEGAKAGGFVTTEAEAEMNGEFDDEEIYESLNYPDATTASPVDEADRLVETEEGLVTDFDIKFPVNNTDPTPYAPDIPGKSVLPKRSRQRFNSSKYKEEDELDENPLWVHLEIISNKNIIAYSMQGPHKNMIVVKPVVSLPVNLPVTVIIDMKIREGKTYYRIDSNLKVGDFIVLLESTNILL